MRIRIVEKKLGRERALGQCYHGENVVEIDPRQGERERLDTLIHEVLHLAKPDLIEDEVIRMANILSKQVWKCGYRRILKS